MTQRTIHQSEAADLLLKSSDSDDSPNVHVCRAPTSAVDCGRVAVLSSRLVPSAPKRLRLTSRNLRMSQASTMPAAEFDLTRADSDLDTGRSIQADRPRFEPWVGGTPSSPFKVVAPLPALPPASPQREEDLPAEDGDTEILGDLEEEVHDTVPDAAPVLAVGVPEIPEDVMDDGCTT